MSSKATEFKRFVAAGSALQAGVKRAKWIGWWRWLLFQRRVVKFTIAPDQAKIVKKVFKIDTELYKFFNALGHQKDETKVALVYRQGVKLLDIMWSILSKSAGPKTAPLLQTLPKKARLSL
jgi:hypothetical protein